MVFLFACFALFHCIEQFYHRCGLCFLKQTMGNEEKLFKLLPQPLSYRFVVKF